LVYNYKKGRKNIKSFKNKKLMKKTKWNIPHFIDVEVQHRSYACGINHEFIVSSEESDSPSVMFTMSMDGLSIIDDEDYETLEKEGYIIPDGYFKTSELEKELEKEYKEKLQEAVKELGLNPKKCDLPECPLLPITSYIPVTSIDFCRQNFELQK